MELSERRKGLSRALRGVVGVFGRGDAAPRRTGEVEMVESVRGLDFERGLASDESEALYFLVD
jgi:hypothetical protein